MQSETVNHEEVEFTRDQSKVADNSSNLAKRINPSGQLKEEFTGHRERLLSDNQIVRKGSTNSTAGSALAGGRRRASTKRLRQGSLKNKSPSVASLSELSLDSQGSYA